MAPNETAHAGLGALLAPEDSVVLLVDHQAFQFANMHSHESQLVVGNVLALARIARIVGVPKVLLCEWQRDWARQETIPALAGILTEHRGGSGVAFSWEAQLLAAGGKSG
jgi:nicotinamidase-related amidase